MRNAVVPTGRQFLLDHAGTSAVVTEVGAHLRSLRIDGVDVLTSFGADELPPASSGAVLAPWPNRLRDGAYTFDGVDYAVPINEHARGTALHGLVSWHRWEVAEHSPREVSLSLATVPQPGYPFPLALSLTYAIVGDGELQVTTTARSLGESEAPYGLGFHPWLHPGPGPLEETELSIDAGRWVRTDDRLLPVGIEEIPTALDFRTARALADVRLDDAFVDAGFGPDDRSWLRLHRTDGRTASLWMDRSFSAWQVCTGDELEQAQLRRTGLAAEPMTCVADAFRTGDQLVRLAPGAEHRAVWGIRLD